MSNLPSAIKHVVVLMLENRSCDHLLGNWPGISGPAGKSNVDSEDGSHVGVSFDAEYASPALPSPNNPALFDGDPPHDFVSVNYQLFETPTPSAGTPITCGGFVRAARDSSDAGTHRAAREVMRCFDVRSRLRTTAALASEFVVCDSWFSSVPGPTWPNRLFVHAATSFGKVDNKPRLYPGPTIYDRLDEARVDWAIYYHDIPHSLCFSRIRTRRDSKDRKCIRHIGEFFKDVRGGTSVLPSYVFIEPNYFEAGRGFWGRTKEFGKWIGHRLGLPVHPSMDRANDQHAPHDVRLGEHLIADVYEALRANDDLWNRSLLVVLYDEHGGLFDHREPPSVPSPDGRVSSDPPFDFRRVGLRVPAFVVSPWVKPMVDPTPYEHCSILRTVREHLCPATQPLTQRDATASALAGDMFVASPRSTPRSLPRPTPTFLIEDHGDPGRRRVSELQMSFVGLARAMQPGGPVDLDDRGLGVAPRDVDAIVELDDLRDPDLSEAAGRRIATDAMAFGRRR